jgi:hypothetical protein
MTLCGGGCGGGGSGGRGAPTRCGGGSGGGYAGGSKFVGKVADKCGGGTSTMATAQSSECLHHAVMKLSATNSPDAGEGAYSIGARAGRMLQHTLRSLEATADAR